MPLIAVIGGPTASGKSALALRWAQARGLEILSADSRQIYRGFAIGTGAPAEAERALVPHHLVGHVDPREPYSPQRFRAEAEFLVESRPSVNFVVVGGTGLYLKEWMFPSREDRGEIPSDIRAAAEREVSERGVAAVHAGLIEKDPGGMAGVAPQDRYRVQKRLENWLFTGKSYVRAATDTVLNPLFRDAPFVWLDPQRPVLHAAIEARVRALFAQGWIAEVEALLRTFDPATTPAFNALGYAEIAEALREGTLRSRDGDPTVSPASNAPEELVQRIVAHTRQYAKKQTTFLRHQFAKVKEGEGSQGSMGEGGVQARAWDPNALAERLESSHWDAKSLFQD